MGKIWTEICLISARGLLRSSSFWKREWFAVGWIDPECKYCTKVDASGNKNPVWRTKFAILVDDSEPNAQDLALNVEVYSRDRIFYREKLHGSATVILKEFLAKHDKNPDASRPGNEDVGSYQLRNKKSNKPRGFIDLSVRISEEKEEPNSFSGNGGEFLLLDGGNNTQLTTQGGLGQPYSQQLSIVSFQRPENQAQSNVPYSHPMPFPINYSNPSVGGPSYPSAAGPSYRAPQTPPPPPSNVGYIPAFYPKIDQGTSSYINMPSSQAAPGRRGPPNFAMGAGAGALAAGAVIYGDDFMSGFDAPSGIGDTSLAISIDPPF